MVHVTTLSTIKHPPACDNYKAKKAFLGAFDSTVSLTLDLLTPKFEAFILAPKSVNGKCLVEVRQQIPKISC